MIGPHVPGGSGGTHNRPGGCIAIGCLIAGIVLMPQCTHIGKRPSGGPVTETIETMDTFSGGDPMDHAKRTGPARTAKLLAYGGLTLVVAMAGAACPPTPPPPSDQAPFDAVIEANAAAMLAEGRQIFRFDTFGDEDFWGGTLRLHEAVATLTPTQVLGLGLKVDSDMLPASLISDLEAGNVNLDDPAVTLSLLKLKAVVGVTGIFNQDQTQLTSIGIQCALCHSTVDDAVAPGIGHRLDGWANRDLNIGAVISAAPDLSYFANLLGISQEDVRAALMAWGPGKFDAELPLDGKAFRPDGKTAAVLIPPAFGLEGVNLHSWVGWGAVPYWNAFVANLEMHGKGRFFDPRLDNADKFPIAAAHPEQFGHKMDSEDLITPKLTALHAYQMDIPAPTPPAGSFDAAAAQRGQAVFTGRCDRCHMPTTFTDSGWNLHTPEEIGIDSFQADRGPENRYRTSPLKGLWSHQKGGFFHDGRFPTLLDVVNHYNIVFSLNLTEQQKSDLVQYLLSL